MTMSIVSIYTFDGQEILRAVRITGETCVGTIGQEYPYSTGNCFDVELEDGVVQVRIVNFLVENLEELIRRGLKWPVGVIVLKSPNSRTVGVLHDERISDKWYCKYFCETCCPRELLPLPQRLRQLRAIARGDRTETGTCYKQWIGEGNPNRKLEPT